MSIVGLGKRVRIYMGEQDKAPGHHAPASQEAQISDRPALVVGNLMRTDVPSVAADATLGEVLDAVTSTRLNRAIVVGRDGRVLGMVTDQDLLAQLDPGAETGLIAALMRRGRVSPEATAAASTLARDVMRGPVVAVATDTPVSEAAHRMLEARRTVLPITDAEGHLLGVVNRADLLSAVRGTGSAGESLT